MRVILVVAGTRGDVQPCVALAKRLQQHGHYVRLATHDMYQDLVQDAGVDFCSLAGDPVALTKVSVDARGMLPCSIDDFKTVRREYQALIDSLPAACSLPEQKRAEDGQVSTAPDLIITTPITYGVPHVAEALRVPVHVVSAVPWYPSHLLAHPWARAFDMGWVDIADKTLDWLLPPWTPKVPTASSYTEPMPVKGSTHEVENTATDLRRHQPAQAQFACEPAGAIDTPLKHTESGFAKAAQQLGPVPANMDISNSKDKAAQQLGPVPANMDISNSKDKAHQRLRPSTKLGQVYERARQWLRQWTLGTVSWYSTSYLDRMVVMGIMDMLVGLRLKLGLRPWGPGWDQYRWPHTFTFSRHLLQPPSDWPAHTHVCGPLLLDQQYQWQHPHAPTASAVTPGTTPTTPTVAAGTPLATALSAALDRLLPELSISSHHELFLDAELLRTASARSSVEMKRAASLTQAHDILKDMELFGATGQVHKEVGNDTTKEGVSASLLMPPALDKFLSAGEAPLYVGFGSCSAQLAADIPLPVTTVMAAILADVRVVINRSMWVGVSEEWSAVAEAVLRAAAAHNLDISPTALTPESLKSRIYLVDDMPHDRLLPRCSGVVHHGGVGTLQAGLLAGCPTLVCPVYGDQFWWGDVVHKALLGPEPIPAHKVDTLSLTQGFKSLHEPTYADHALHLSQLLEEETSQSLDVAVKHILEHVRCTKP